MAKTKSRNPRARTTSDYPLPVPTKAGYTPERLAGLGGGPKLREGEVSDKVRVRTTTHGMSLINDITPELRGELILRGLGTRDADRVADLLDHTYPGRLVVPYATPDAPGLYLPATDKIVRQDGNLDWAHEVTQPEDTVVARLDANNIPDAWATLPARRVVLVVPSTVEYGGAWEPYSDPEAPDRVILLRR